MVETMEIAAPRRSYSYPHDPPAELDWPGVLAEQEAVRVFAANLRDLLLAAPAGARATMGLDPGFRTGVKVAVVDATGKVAAQSWPPRPIPRCRPRCVAASQEPSSALMSVRAKVSGYCFPACVCSKLI
jgi:hypothetical protein